MPAQKGIINSDQSDKNVEDIDDIDSEEILDYEENRVGKLILKSRSILLAQTKKVLIKLFLKG